MVLELIRLSTKITDYSRWYYLVAKVLMILLEVRTIILLIIAVNNLDTDI